jgi:uncharacterized protein (TIGR02145 family)
MSGEAVKNVVAYTPVVLEDVSADFSTGFAIPAYQWYSSDVSNNTNPTATTSHIISGATSSSYTAIGLTQGVTSTSYYFFCMVSNSACPTAPAMASGVYTVNVVAPLSCGAYTAKDKTIAVADLVTATNITWRQFMCYNLGADYNLDPFTPAKGLNGNYYQWNRKIPVADVNTPSTWPGPGTWDFTGDITATEWEAANDPCPAGFRVPTQAEWQGVVTDSRNTATNAPGSTWASDGNFISGKLIGTAMYLPAAGTRNSNDGLLTSRGYSGYYWSSTQYNNNSSLAYCLYANSGTPTVGNNTRAIGFSIRCIADEPIYKPKIVTQPRAFLFNETGSGNFLTINPETGVQEMTSSLTIVVSPVSSNWTYQWYTVNNNRNATGIAIRSAIAGATSTSYTIDTPTGTILRGVTTNGNNVGLYRYQCIATLHDGSSAGPVIETLTSDIAEVAVGCGAKTINGDWLSFMCFNLGTTMANPTIANQKNQVVTLGTNSPGNEATFANEQAVWGSLFQWGRIADGHEQRTSIAVPFGAISDTDLIDPNDNYTGAICTSNQPNFQVKPASTTWFGKFIATIDIDPAWNPSNRIDADLLWHNGRYIPNDPCTHIQSNGTYASGWYTTVTAATCADPGTNWRTPTSGEWSSIYRNSPLSGSPGTATANTWSWYSGNNKGQEIKPDGTQTTLFLPACGGRLADGSYYNRGSIGSYWSTTCTSNSTYAYRMNFNGNSIDTAYPNSFRANGFAIRCIANN